MGFPGRTDTILNWDRSCHTAEKVASSLIVRMVFVDIELELV